MACRVGDPSGFGVPSCGREHEPTPTAAEISAASQYVVQRSGHRQEFNEPPVQRFDRGGQTRSARSLKSRLLRRQIKVTLVRCCRGFKRRLRMSVMHIVPCNIASHAKRPDWPIARYDCPIRRQMPAVRRAGVRAALSGTARCDCAPTWRYPPVGRSRRFHPRRRRPPARDR